jgi:MYXO-CTERM domain-containing protein
VVSSHDAANRFIPHAARAATTRAEIVALITGELPDTAAADSAPAPAPDTIVVAILPVAAVVAAFLRRRRVVEASREPDAIAS